MNTRPSAVVLAAILIVATSACRADTGTPGFGAPGRTQPKVASAPALEAPAAPRPAIMAGGVARAASQPVPVPADRKIIRNGTIDLEVRAIDAALQSVRGQVQAAGGYTTNESQSQDEYGVKSASITCRVPADKLDATLAKIKELGKVEQVSITADDVTEQYFDVEIRLRTQRQLESRLLELLNRPSNKLSDLLEVERELARVRGEIDQLEGRKRYWDNQVALSTLAVNVREPRPAIAGEGGGAWHTLVNSFRSAGENFVLAIAAIIAFSGALVPSLVALALFVWIVRKLWRWRRAAR